MSYKKIKSYEMTEAELRDLWSDTYCNAPITTFDGIEVKFYSNMFDHAFFESSNRKAKDKSILSFNRCEKMLWIKDVLIDNTALVKKGWDNVNKCYVDDKRVSLVKGNYIVVIQLYRTHKARFVTAYQIDNEDNLNEIINSPNWT